LGESHQVAEELFQQEIDRFFSRTRGVILDGRTLGVIRVTDLKDKAEFFTASDERLIAGMANHIAAAITYCQRHETRIKLLDELDELLEGLTKSIPKLGEGIEAFEGAFLEKAAKSAAEIFETDVLTLYEFNSELNDFETPPIWKGHISLTMSHLEKRANNCRCWFYLAVSGLPSDYIQGACGRHPRPQLRTEGSPKLGLGESNNWPSPYENLPEPYHGQPLPSVLKCDIVKLGTVGL